MICERISVVVPPLMMVQEITEKMLKSGIERMSLILALLREWSMSKLERYDKESNKNLICVKEILEALLSSLLVNSSIKKIIIKVFTF